MTANISYQSSAGLHVTALNPAYTKSSEPDHLYEELPEDLAGEKKETSATDGGNDDYYVNDDLHPGREGNTEQHSVEATNGMRSNKGSEDDDKAYDDLVIEDAKMQSRSKNTGTKECKGSDDYYANDDLFPEKVKEKLHPDDQKNSADGCDYYVNAYDDLVPENTKGELPDQTKEKVVKKEGDRLPVSSLTR